MANEWEAELKRTSPVDTGLMRQETRAREGGTANTISVTATVDTDYAQMVSTGTRPHKITAKPGGVLRFQWHGRTVYFRSVNHPGTRPNTWWTDSLRNLSDLSQRVWNRL